MNHSLGGCHARNNNISFVIPPIAKLKILLLITINNAIFLFPCYNVPSFGKAGPLMTGLATLKLPNYYINATGLPVCSDIVALDLREVDF